MANIRLRLRGGTRSKTNLIQSLFFFLFFLSPDFFIFLFHVLRNPHRHMFSIRFIFHSLSVISRELFFGVFDFFILFWCDKRFGKMWTRWLADFVDFSSFFFLIRQHGLKWYRRRRVCVNFSGWEIWCVISFCSTVGFSKEKLQGKKKNGQSQHLLSKVFFFFFFFQLYCGITCTRFKFFPRILINIDEEKKRENLVFLSTFFLLSRASKE